MIKVLKLIIIIALLSLVLILTFNEVYYADYHTNLSEGVYIQSGESDLVAKQWSVPLAYDWNNDGKKDLLIGHKYTDSSSAPHGFISYFENIGSDTSPHFNGSKQLETCKNECSPINVPALG